MKLRHASEESVKKFVKVLSRDFVFYLNVNECCKIFVIGVWECLIFLRLFTVKRKSKAKPLMLRLLSFHKKNVNTGFLI